MNGRDSLRRPVAAAAIDDANKTRRVLAVVCDDGSVWTLGEHGTWRESRAVPGTPHSATRRT